jgi:hypothetical protein
MELPLIGKTQAGAGIEDGEWRARDAGHVAEPRGMRRGELFFEGFALIALSQEQIAVNPGEIAVDSLRDTPRSA